MVWNVKYVLKKKKNNISQTTEIAQTDDDRVISRRSITNRNT